MDYPKPMYIGIAIADTRKLTTAPPKRRGNATSPPPSIATDDSSFFFTVCFPVFFESDFTFFYAVGTVFFL